MSAPKAQYPISQDNLEAISGLVESVDDDGALFRITFNDFLIMQGLLPDIPIAMRPGMIKVRGVWQAGVLYTQYISWEDKIDKFWGKVDSGNFSHIYGSKN